MSLPDYMLAGRAERPVGISILSILHVFGGALLLAFVAVGLILRTDTKFTESLAAVGIPLPLLLFAFGFLAILNIVSGVAMWRGATWGWYLGSFYCAYAIFRNVNALITVADVFQSVSAGGPPAPGHGAGYYYAKYGARLLVSALLYAYFFKRNVREYFGLQQTRRWLAFVVQFAICIGIALALTAWAQIG